MFLIIVLPILLGCEEIIELDLNSANPELIIEANLTNSLENNFVSITESTDFYNPSQYKAISNAEVIIRENNGSSYILDEVVPGKYVHNSLVSKPETNYNIEVNYLNKNYTAESFSPAAIKIDSLSYLLESRPFNEDKLFLELHVYFQDNPDQSNNGRFVVYKNGEKINRIFLYEDRLTNGNYIDFFFFNFDNEEVFSTGDVISVELQSIDEQTHTYFKTIRKALARSTGGPFGPAAPANPITNWSNNGFGYFSAFSISSDSLIIE